MGLRQKILNKATSSFLDYAHKLKKSKLRYIIIVDYSIHSKNKRLFVYDREAQRVIRSHHCAHGKNSSSPEDLGRAVRFSNRVMSKCSSIGAAVTGGVYYGKYGRSLNLKGLESTNNNMFKRRIVLHKSNYVTDNYIARRGRCGQSWGCLSVDPAIKDSLIDLIKGGTFVYLYGEES